MSPYPTSTQVTRPKVSQVARLCSCLLHNKTSLSGGVGVEGKEEEGGRATRFMTLTGNFKTHERLMYGFVNGEQLLELSANPTGRSRIAAPLSCLSPRPRSGASQRCSRLSASVSDPTNALACRLDLHRTPSLVCQSVPAFSGLERQLRCLLF